MKLTQKIISKTKSLPSLIPRLTSSIFISDWLEGLNLTHYTKIFQQNGYYDLSKLYQNKLNRKDLQEMGIDDQDDQEILLNYIENLGSTHSAPELDQYLIPWLEINCKFRLNKRLSAETFIAEYKGKDVYVVHYSKECIKPKTFVKRSRLLCKIRHPNIIHPIGVCYDENIMAIIWPWQKENLRDVLRREELTEIEKINITKDIIFGVEFFHKNLSTSLHGELFSYNIYLSNNRAKIGPSVGMIGAKVQKHAYSPECFDKIYNVEGDIFMLGTILWEIVTNASLPIPKNYQVNLKLDTPFVKFLIPLINHCWSSFVEQRPNINVIKDSFLNFKELKPNYVEEPLNSSTPGVEKK